MKISTEKHKLTLKQEKAILCLLSSTSNEEAAAAAGVSRITLWRWQQQPEFLEKLNEAKQKAIEDAARMIQCASAKAASILITIANDQSAHSAHRVAAAKAILNYSMKIREQEDLKVEMPRVKVVYNFPGSEDPPDE